MTQIVQHVAYGFNGDSIPKMKDSQLISAFFIASENLPEIEKSRQRGIKCNMGRIGDELSDRVDSAKGKRKIRLDVHLMVMRTILKEIYKVSPSV